jgi:hypothetical protein
MSNVNHSDNARHSDDENGLSQADNANQVADAQSRDSGHLVRWLLWALGAVIGGGVVLLLTFMWILLFLILGLSREGPAYQQLLALVGLLFLLILIGIIAFLVCLGLFGWFAMLLLDTGENLRPEEVNTDGDDNAPSGRDPVVHDTRRAIFRGSKGPYKAYLPNGRKVRVPVWFVVLVGRLFPLYGGGV